MEYIDGFYFIASLGSGIGFNHNEHNLKLFEHNANIYTASTLVN
ncbi:hypothetical protein bthur0005_23730 [Bacillus thuringiensis serovar pakistani str. T13001]|nr:hypothetical protein bthur0005_23730 [Bacillus thuringiensis serovar pakistani str. T13001]